MNPFELAEPQSLGEAVALLDPDDARVRPIAGGTALMLMMKTGFFEPTRLVSLRRVEPRYAQIDEVDGALRIGALAPLSVIERSPVVRAAAPVITATLKTLSNVRVRNVATLGGHLAHADPRMDLPPVLMALGAEVSVVWHTGTRTIPIAELFAGYYQTALAGDELIAEVRVPRSKVRAAYMKCTTRSADDWPALGVAAALEVENGRIHAARLVLGAVTATPTRLAKAEAALIGGTADDTTLEHVGEAAAVEAQVSGDALGSAPYKRQLVRVYVRRAIRRALAS
jgi:carbon-monoxide dehydrogenase medium subunit